MLPASRAGNLMGSVEETRACRISISFLVLGKADRGVLLGSRGRGVGTFSVELRPGTFWAFASDHKPTTASEARSVPARKRRVITISPRFRAREFFARRITNRARATDQTKSRPTIPWLHAACTTGAEPCRNARGP